MHDYLCPTKVRGYKNNKYLCNNDVSFTTRIVWILILLNCDSHSNVSLKLFINHSLIKISFGAKIIYSLAWKLFKTIYVIKKGLFYNQIKLYIIDRNSMLN